MRAMLGAVAAIALVGCATAPQFPVARPLTQQHIDTMGATRIVVSENNHGVEKAWFFTSTQGAGAAYGLIGVIVSAAMDAIINAGPSRRAQKAADEMAELFPADTLNASLTEQLRQQTPEAQAASAQARAAAEAQAAAEAAAAAQAAAAETGTIPASVTVTAAPAPVEPVAIAAPTGVWYQNIETAQRLGMRDTLDDAVEISVRYTLSEDASTLRVIAVATYANAALPYSTRYSFANSVPKAEREGPVYRNTFTYYSTQLPVPTLSAELRERLIANIQDSARDANGALPAEGTDEYRSMERELANARDNSLSKDEIAIFLTREWLRDDGALIRQEIERAHEFVARYVLVDMNRTLVPSLAGQDELLETASDSRTVRRIGAGVAAGSYVSSAANVTSASTYGNTIGIARTHRERMESVQAAARRTR